VTVPKSQRFFFLFFEKLKKNILNFFYFCIFVFIIYLHFYNFWEFFLIKRKIVSQHSLFFEKYIHQKYIFWVSFAIFSIPGCFW
jgi:hypothetical protein